MQPRRSRIALIVLAGLLGTLAFTIRTVPHTNPPNGTSKPALSPSAPVAKRQLLLFTQTTCPPCRVVEASLKDAAVKAYLSERFELAIVSWPDDRFGQYGITATPTLVCGEKKRAGGIAPAELLAWLKTLGSAKPRKPKGPNAGSGKIVEAGYDGPGGRRVMIDFPPEWWKANITSRGQGCCVQRSCDFAAHEQNVTELWDFPEWVRKKGLPGGAYPEELARRITAICKDRNAEEPSYINVESKDYSLLQLVLATGRLACVDYAGSDGVHYSGPIAHMVCIAYADAEYVAILDNNFPPDKLLWMPASEFQKRWPGWLVALLAPRAPVPPKN